MVDDGRSDADGAVPVGRRRAVVARLVEWSDTDATGHHHHGVVLRWFEAAEAALLRAAGHPDLVRHIPRVRYEVDYRSRVFHGDVVTTTITVERLGRSSLTYAFAADCDGRLVATGRAVVVHAPDAHSGAEPWPDDVRAALAPTTDLP